MCGCGNRVMDEAVYDALMKYYAALGKIGYIKHADVFGLILLCFYRDFVFEDYRAVLSYDDYRDIDRALSCLFGSSCLIPYIDYVKMCKLYLGQMTEMASRVKTLENTQVLKVIENLQGIENADSESDIRIIADE